MADSILTDAEKRLLAELEARDRRRLRLPVLPLRRILHSKRAAGRPKDLAAVHAIEDAIALLEHDE